MYLSCGFFNGLPAPWTINLFLDGLNFLDKFSPQWLHWAGKQGRAVSGRWQVAGGTWHVARGCLHSQRHFNRYSRYAMMGNEQAVPDREVLFYSILADVVSLCNVHLCNVFFNFTEKTLEAGAAGEEHKW